MPDTVHVPGAELAVQEWGSGRPVLLVHGIADRGAGWADLAAQVAGGGDREHPSPGGAAARRVIAYDRRGYGGSTAPEPYERTTVAEQAEDAAALLASLDAVPAVVSGRDLGALVALDLAKRHRAGVAGVVAVDPPLYAFSAAATEVLSAERLALEDALRDGGPAAAVRAWLAARGAAAERPALGAKGHEAVSPDRLAWAEEDHGAFFADFAALATWPILRRELRAFDFPLTVLLSATAPAHVREGAEALASLVPGATLGAESDLVPALRGVAAG